MTNQVTVKDIIDWSFLDFFKSRKPVPGCKVCGRITQYVGGDYCSKHNTPTKNRPKPKPGTVNCVQC